ncbi:MAG: helix-turn-helix domain-containing protein [Candidatus Latescibacteria bacterium]|nr:helix-turn-helix domain-containing protein [Candidatus Latescibacterota bacterium]
MEIRETSVYELVSNATPVKALDDEVEGYPKGCNVSRTLADLRWSRDLTQEELAKRAGCTQSKISRIENSSDDRLKLEDLAIYARAFNMQVSIDFARESSTTDATERLARQIRNSLAEVAEKVEYEVAADERVRESYESFLFDMLDLFMENLEGLRTRQNGSPDSGETTRAGNDRPMAPMVQNETLSPERRKNGSTGIRIHTPVDIGEGNGRTESPSRQ